MFFQTSVGVDIGFERIAVVCLKKTVKGVRVTAHSFFYLRKEKPVADRLDGFAEWLQSFLKENRAGGGVTSDIYLGIPRELAVIKTLRFPLAVKENIHSAVRFDLEKHVPIPEHDVCFDCQILSEEKSQKQLHILLVIAKKQDILHYLKAMRSLGRIAGIDLASAGMFNYMHHSQKPTTSGLAIADIIRKRSDENDAVDLSGTDLPTSELAPAYGLALKGLTSVPVDLNLIPTELRKKPSRLGIYTMLVLVVFLFLSAVAVAGSYFVRQNLILKRLDAQLSGLSSKISDLDRIRQRNEELEDRLSYLKTLNSGDISALDILRELTRVIPDTAWVQSLTYSEEGLQIEGHAESATELIPLLEASPMLRNVVFLSTITKGRDGKERFRIGLDLVS